MRRARLGLSQLCAVEFHPVDHALFRSACNPPMTQSDTAFAKHCVPHAPSTLCANEMEHLRAPGHNNPWIVCITVCQHLAQQWAAAAVGSMSHRPILLVEVPECGHWGPFSVPASHSCDMSEPRPPTAAEVSTFEQFAKVIFVISFSLL